MDPEQLWNGMKGSFYGDMIWLTKIALYMSLDAHCTRQIVKNGEVLDGWWGLYPLGRRARVTIPVK